MPLGDKDDTDAHTHLHSLCESALQNRSLARAAATLSSMVSVNINGYAI